MERRLHHNAFAMTTILSSLIEQVINGTNAGDRTQQGYNFSSCHHQSFLETLVTEHIICFFNRHTVSMLTVVAMYDELHDFELVFAAG